MEHNGHGSICGTCRQHIHASLVIGLGHDCPGPATWDEAEHGTGDTVDPELGTELGQDNTGANHHPDVHPLATFLSNTTTNNTLTEEAAVNNSTTSTSASTETSDSTTSIDNSTTTATQTQNADGDDEPNDYGVPVTDAASNTSSSSSSSSSSTTPSLTPIPRPLNPHRNGNETSDYGEPVITNGTEADEHYFFSPPQTRQRRSYSIESGPIVPFPDFVDTEPPTTQPAEHNANNSSVATGLANGVTPPQLDGHSAEENNNVNNSSVATGSTNGVTPTQLDEDNAGEKHNTSSSATPTQSDEHNTEENDNANSSSVDTGYTNSVTLDEQNAGENNTSSSSVATGSTNSVTPTFPVTRRLTRQRGNTFILPDSARPRHLTNLLNNNNNNTNTNTALATTPEDPENESAIEVTNDIFAVAPNGTSPARQNRFTRARRERCQTPSQPRYHRDQDSDDEDHHDYSFGTTSGNSSFYIGLNTLFDRLIMSQNSISNSNNNNNGAGNNHANNPQGLFTNFLENTGSNTGNMNVSRQSTPSPTGQHPAGQVNGAAGMAGMNMPMNAGHQMDLNYLYEMVLELSDVLKNNRDKTKGIINSAEEIMRRANTEGASPSIQQANGEITAGRIAELERALAREKRLTEVLKREQVENTKLIGEYEGAVGTMVEQIRNYCQNNNMNYLGQKRHYNNLLQAERDAHLESRLERDEWHAKTMRVSEMIRTAYRIRCEEDDMPIQVVQGLQNEVRALRNALGMEPEKPEEETGWEVLKDAPGGPDLGID